MRNKILLCIYGQVRTLNYCLPYLLSSFELLAKKLNADIDVTTVLKVFNTAINTDNEIDSKEANYPSIPSFVKLPVLMSKEFEDRTIRSVKHRSPYSPYIQTLTQCLKNIWELDNNYDIVFMVRSDSLVGSSLNSLANNEAGCLKILESNTFDRTVYAHHSIFRMEKEFNKLGMGDFFYYGNQVSIKLLLSYLLHYTRSTDSDVYPKMFNLGPNVLLYRSCVENEIQVKETSVDTTIVRPSSDLTQDVFTSFYSHKNHFLSSHKTLQK